MDYQAINPSAAFRFLILIPIVTPRPCFCFFFPELYQIKYILRIGRYGVVGVFRDRWRELIVLEVPTFIREVCAAELVLFSWTCIIIGLYAPRVTSIEFLRSSSHVMRSISSGSAPLVGGFVTATKIELTYFAAGILAFMAFINAAIVSSFRATSCFVPAVAYLN